MVIRWFRLHQKYATKKVLCRLFTNLITHKECFEAGKHKNKAFMTVDTKNKNGYPGCNSKDQKQQGSTHIYTNPKVGEGAPKT